MQSVSTGFRRFSRQYPDLFSTHDGLNEFRQLLAARRIPPHVGIEEFEQDLETLRQLEA